MTTVADILNFVESLWLVKIDKKLYMYKVCNQFFMFWIYCINNLLKFKPYLLK